MRWTIIVNTPGYMPDNDLDVDTDDFEEAREALSDELLLTAESYGLCDEYVDALAYLTAAPAGREFTVYLAGVAHSVILAD